MPGVVDQEVDYGPVRIRDDARAGRAPAPDPRATDSYRQCAPRPIARICRPTALARSAAAGHDDSPVVVGDRFANPKAIERPKTPCCPGLNDPDLAEVDPKLGRSWTDRRRVPGGASRLVTRECLRSLADVE